MELLSIFMIPLLFSITIYFLVYKKDEKYLNALGDRARTQQNEIRRLQAQLNSVYSKLHTLDQFCQYLRPQYQSAKRFSDEQTSPHFTSPQMSKEEVSLMKLEKEITSIKEILNLGHEDPF